MARAPVRAELMDVHVTNEVRRAVSRPANGFRVGIMGASLHTGNRGVSALGVSLASLIWYSRPDAKISLLIGHRDANATEVRLDGCARIVETVNYRLSPRAVLGQQLWWIVLMSFVYRALPWIRSRRWIADSSPWIRAVVEADLIGDIRGGDSFSDIYGTKEFCVGSLPVLSVILLRGDIHLLPQTYGPFSSQVAKRLARYILLRAGSIWCRDSISVEQVWQLTGGRRTGMLCPDVAFALEAVRPGSLAVEPPLDHENGTTLVGLNVSGLVYNGGYTRANMFGLRLDYRTFVTRLVEQVLADESNRVLLVPHTFAPEGRVESDPGACRDLIRSLPSSLRHRVHLVTTDYDQHQIKGIIGLCAFFIGSRMHACIAALSQGIPTVGVAYSRKFVGVFETVGAADWVVDGRTHDVDEALSRVQDLFNKRDVSRSILARSVPAAQTELHRAFDQIVGIRSSSRSRPGEPDSSIPRLNNSGIRAARSEPDADPAPEEA